LGTEQDLPDSQLCRHPVYICAEHFKQCTQVVPGLVQDELKVVHAIPVRTEDEPKIVYAIPLRIASLGKHLMLS